MRASGSQVRFHATRLVCAGIRCRDAAGAHDALVSPDGTYTRGRRHGPHRLARDTRAPRAQRVAGRRRTASTEDEVGRGAAAGQGNDVDVHTGRTYGQIVRENVFNFINNLFFTLGVILVALGRSLDAFVSRRS